MPLTLGAPISTAALRVVLGALLAFVFALASPVTWAHAEFTGSTPAADATLSNSPQEIVLHFSQAVTPVTVTLLGPHGVPVDTDGAATAKGERVILALPEQLEPGGYAVSFSVLSGDAHSILGDFRFSIVTPEAAVQPEIEAGAEPLPTGSPLAKPEASQKVAVEASLFERLEQIARAAFIVTLLLAVGLILFRVLVTLSGALDDWAIARIRVLGLVGLTFAIVYFLISTVAVTGLDAFRARHLIVLLQTSIGMSLLLASIGFLLLATHSASQSIVMGVAAALLIISRVVTGHPASQEPAVLLVPSMAIHVAAAGFWFASLWVMLRLLQRGPLEDTLRILHHFALVALWGVSALLAVGIVMATVHLQSVDALLSTDYGFALLVKLIGVAGLLLLAAANKFWLTPRLVMQHDSRSLRASIRLELLLMLAVIAVSTILATTRPPANSSEIAAVAAPHIAGEIRLEMLVLPTESDRGAQIER